ncbi:globin family protein [Roseobacter weihaiensis]|uniref:hypothetical protein n=1 Tax=Roseobacter weihaiensis TaxID=2763262 RepID=UPI001D0BD099|nr:hypothetical protein [Roseobacter sp. H9]
MDKALDDEDHTGPHVDRLRVVFRRVAAILINDMPDWEEGNAADGMTGSKFSRARGRSGS